MSRPRLAAVMLAAALISACGLPSDHDAKRIPDDEVPFGLLSTAPAAPATPPPGDRLLAVYFVRNDRLARVARRVAAGPDPARALRELVSGPTPAETGAGIGTTTLGADLSVTAGPNPGTVTVDLGNAIGEVPSHVQVLALAQIVFTLADLPAVQAVRFTVAGQPVDVLRGDGSLADGPVTPNDYAEYAPR